MMDTDLYGFGLEYAVFSYSVGRETYQNVMK